MTMKYYSLGFQVTQGLVEMSKLIKRQDLWGLGINSKTPNRILTHRLPDTKCINASPRIRLHASIRLKSEKRKMIRSKVANGKRSRQN